MTCAEAEDQLLDSLDGRLPDQIRRALDGHVAGCARCAAFAMRMQAVDEGLVAALPPPAVPPSIAAQVRTRARRERLSAIGESLPDIIHLAGCGIATVLSAVLLPIEAPITVAAGLALTSATYVVMALVRWSLEAVDQPDW
jgi:anti-sigma factor RsiW